MEFSMDSYSKQKSELEQKKQQALVEQNTTEVENLEQQLLKLEEQKAQFEQLSSTEIPQHQQDQITELGGDTTITNAVDQQIHEVTQETVEKVAEVTKPLSALEKARLLKEQKAQEKLEAEQHAHQQELQAAEQAEASYTQLQQQLEDLENQKKEIQEKIDEQKQIRKEKIDSQRSALRELLSDEETKELLKDADTKQEIFGDDQAALDEAKEIQRGLEKELKSLEDQIEITKLQVQEIYKETPEGLEKIEKERIEQEEAQKAEQERIKKEEMVKVNRVLGVNIQNQNSDFFKSGVIDFNENSFKKAEQEFGAEKVKETFDTVIDEQIQGLLNVERNKWGISQLREGVEKYDTALELYNKYQREYQTVIRNLESQYKQFEQIREEIANLPFPDGIVKDKFKELSYKILGIDSYYHLDKLAEGWYKEMSDDRLVLDIESAKNATENLKRGIIAFKDIFEKLKDNPTIDLLNQVQKNKRKEVNFGEEVKIDDVVIPNPNTYNHGSYKTIKYRAFDKYRFDDLKYNQNIHPNDRERNSIIEKTVSIEDARRLLSEGESKIIAKEKAMKETANAQFEQQQLFIETREKFKIQDGYTINLESEFNNYNSYQEKLKRIYSEVAQRSSQLESMKDAEIANYGGSIIFKQNQELNDLAKEKINILDSDEQKLVQEKKNLQLEMSKAMLGIGNSGREKKITEIDGSITKIREEKIKLETETRNRPIYMEVGQILRDLNIDTGEILTGARTAGELMKKLQDKISEDQKISFDPEKKEYINKLKDAQALVDQKKSAIISMNSNR